MEENLSNSLLLRVLAFCLGLILITWSLALAFESFTAGDFLGRFEGFLALTKLRHAINELVARFLHDSSEDPGANTKADGCHVHAEGHWSGCEDSTPDATVANHEELEIEFAKEDNPVPEVGEWA